MSHGHGTDSIAQVSISGGEAVRIRAASAALIPLNVSPDGAELLVKDYGAAGRGQFWSLPILGGSPRQLGNIVGIDGSWSPDGSMLVYSDNSELFLARSDGTESRKLVSVRDESYSPPWSPDGSKLRFNVDDSRTTKVQYGKSQRKGRIYTPCFPAGTILHTNAAGNGLRMGNTSCFSRTTRSGLFRKGQGFSANPRANPSG
jgi:Tol biopolymer transport system component